MTINKQVKAEIKEVVTTEAGVIKEVVEEVVAIKTVSKEVKEVG